MAKIISTIKAILTRIIFSVHSLIAVYTVYALYGFDSFYAILCSPLLVLLLEGIFTLAIKKNQEWRWFCPSVFIYLLSVVPAIWLLELNLFEARAANSSVTSNKNDTNGNLTTYNYLETKRPNSSGIASTKNDTSGNLLSSLDNILGGGMVKKPDTKDTWIKLIEQFLMLILIVGRWLLPKGDLTRDQLSQLLLVYIGTAADIIEFFESYKSVTGNETILVYLTLGIWSWSLLQFTIVLSATRARRSRGGGSHHIDDSANCCNDCCCGIDVWGIVLNVLLQDAPFLAFRLLIIIKYNNISYMNIFFTCKNSLVIALQFYRLYAVNSEFWRARRELKNRTKKNYNPKQTRSRRVEEDEDIYVISTKMPDVKKKAKRKKAYSDEEADERKRKYKKKKKRARKDTGYSTASSQNLYSTKLKDKKKDKKKIKSKISHLNYDSEEDFKKKRKLKEEKVKPKKSKREAVVMEESSSSESSESSNSCYEVINEKKSKKKKRKPQSSSSSDSSSSEDSSETST
ncbi:hypothetical protein ACFFRR_007132 [Megaselia abdita]